LGLLGLRRSSKHGDRNRAGYKNMWHSDSPVENRIVCFTTVWEARQAVNLAYAIRLTRSGCRLDDRSRG
jgi:hypothetical protein